MTTTTEECVAASEVQAAIDAGIELAVPTVVDDEHRLLSVVVPDGARHLLVDVDGHREAAAVHPKRKTGTVRLHDADAFVTYVARHATGSTEVFASVDDLDVVAVIDSDAVTTAGRKDHVARLTLKTPPAWAAWTSVDGKLLDQVAFAELVEGHLGDVVEPDAATLLEIVTTFTAKKGLDFQQATRLSDGQTRLVYSETVAASAGQKGELAIPERVALALAPFRGVAPFRVTARLRVRIGQAGLGIGLVFDELDKVVETAFGDVVDQVRGGLADTPAAPVVMGRPS
ncbi:MAG: YfdQ family protein [Micrococcales bacterium]|nr:YfdQ family protein [Micrococcales bacterium]